MAQEHNKQTGGMLTRLLAWLIPARAPAHVTDTPARAASPAATNGTMPMHPKRQRKRRARLIQAPPVCVPSSLHVIGENGTDDLKKILTDPARKNPVLIFFAAADKGSDTMAPLARRVIKSANDRAAVFYLDAAATRSWGGTPGVIHKFMPGSNTGIAIDAGNILRACRTSGFYESNAMPNPTPAIAKPQTKTPAPPRHIENSGHVRNVFQAQTGNTIVLVTAQTARALQNVGRVKGPPVVIYNLLVEKLADPRGKLEPKGRAFWGVNLGREHRALFCVLEDHRAALVYIGSHKEYERISTQILIDAANMRNGYLRSRYTLFDLTARAVSSDHEGHARYNARLLCALTIKPMHDGAPCACPRPAAPS